MGNGLPILFVVSDMMSLVHVVTVIAIGLLHVRVCMPQHSFNAHTLLAYLHA